MSAEWWTCPRCGRVWPAGTTYCPTCGEVVDPALSEKLRTLYASLRALDGLIDQGMGATTLTQARDTLLAQYTQLRTPPREAGRPAVAPAAPPVAPAAPAPAAPAVPPVAPVTPAAATTAAATPTGATPLQFMAGVRPGPQAAQPAAAPSARPPTGAPAPHAASQGRVFSWQAFLADQAIAIMAYIGAFLLIVATLTLEVGGWQALPLAVKTFAIVAVYLLFGGFGLVMRRAPRLRTVGDAYLGAFALMTPLVAYAAYRFLLQGVAFVTPVRMLCVSALYAGVIYLLLALRTRFVAYAYLGWVALLIAALALPDALTLSSSWSLVSALLFATLLLLPQWRSRRADIIATPALVVSAVVSGLAALWALLWGLILAMASLLYNLHGDSDLAPFTVAVCVLLALNIAWSATARRLAYVAGDALDLLDALLAPSLTLAVVSLVGQAGGDVRAEVYALAALTGCALVAVIALRRLAPARSQLRLGVELFGAILAGVGAALAFTSTMFSAPDWPLLAMLTVGLLTTLGYALVEGAPWWLLVSGAFLSFEAAVALPVIFVAPDDETIYRLYFALAVVLWLLALGLRERARVKRFAPPVFIVALADGALTTLLFAGADVDERTGILLAFAALAFLAAWRARAGERTLFLLALGCCAFAAPLPYTLDGGDGRLAALALGLALAALLIRRTLGRELAPVPYGAALWAIGLLELHLSLLGSPLAQLTVAGVSATVALTLAFACLATLAALAEGQPWGMALPATLGLLAIWQAANPALTTLLTVALAGVGMSLRWRRGRLWNVPWQVAAALGSVLVLLRLAPSDDGWRVALSLLFAALAYLIAIQERAAWATAFSVPYALLATLTLPAPALPPTLALTLAALLIATLLRLRLRVEWALALYVIAVGASLHALRLAYAGGAGPAEGLALLFAALAYLVATRERSALVTLAPLVYALVAVVIQPDAHALLPLTLLLALAGALLSRLAGPRWGLALYAAAVAAGLATALHGLSSPDFEPLALLVLTLLAYAVAALEARLETLVAALTLGALALGAQLLNAHVPLWQAELAFLGVGWLYYGLSRVWQVALRGVERLPGRPTGNRQTWLAPLGSASDAGVTLHRWAALLIGSVTAFVALLAPDAFTPHAAPAEVAVAGLLAVAGLVAVHGRVTKAALGGYLAGGLVSLAITWQLRWLGADNVQAFTLAPGSYQLLLSALLPADRRLSYGDRAGQFFALSGSLTLLTPTLAQSFVADPNWLYAMGLALESLLVVGLGVGLRRRSLILAGSLFIGVATIRGAAIAITSGAPVALLIAALALLLIGGATWLSLRTRREIG